MGHIAKGIWVDIKRLSQDAILPKAMSQQAAGMDIYACERVEILPGEWRLIHTGVAFALPEGTQMEIRPRSGLALRHGITVLNSPGTIDADYRGELQVALINHGKKVFVVEHGMRIAQAVCMQYVPVNWRLTDELDETERGVGGWGHTG